MKTKQLIAIVTLFIGAVLGAAGAEKWEAHEWGTFTTFSGSDGGILSWYPAQQNAAAELPDFVGFNVPGVGKRFGMKYIARMETPVIYFYTDKPRSVDVKATYHGGVVTEWFPHGSPSSPGHPAIWKNLFILPPEAEGLTEARPPVAETDKGNHYYHAREVPEAALVLDNNREVAQAERFIFYRGAGPIDHRVRASQGKDGSFSVSNFHSKEAMNHSWAVVVKDGAMGWKKLPVVPAAVKETGTAKISIEDDALLSINKAVPKIEASMVAALEQAGLTADEAKAMVNTWESSWFTEPGARIFTIMTQSVIDELLPLEIEPAPNKVKRVFVHRMEILSPETEKLLLAALEEEQVSPGTAKEVARLGLGRFQPAAIERVSEMRNRLFQMETRQRAAAVIAHAKESLKSGEVAAAD